MLLRCLLAESNPVASDRVLRALPGQSIHLRKIHRRADLWTKAMRGGLDVILVAVDLLGERALEFATMILASPMAPEIVFLVNSEDADQRAGLLGAGALAVLNVEVDDQLLSNALTALLQRVEPVEVLPPVDERAHHPTLHDFRTRSPLMERFVELVRRVSDSSSSLLIQGETGVGKEWLARAIHAASRRSGEAFVALNCAAFPETLLDSELFGHEEGSFTGAIRARRGHFELAHGGTILLDEIGDMPLHMQAKLLRVLQEREIMPLGSEEVIQVDVRVLAATNHDMAARVERGRFRSDLHYRLGVITLAIPPLRERREDIPDLAQRYAAELGTAQSGGPFTVDPEAMEILVRHDWPGNVRELVNAIERAVLLSTEPRISCANLGLAITGAPPPGGGVRPGTGPFPDRPLEDLRTIRRRAANAAEHAHLSGLLRRTTGRVGDTARLAGVTPRALHARMRHLGLRKEDFRVPRGVR